MTNKHTQGEWVAKDGQIYPAETGKTIALIPYFDEESEEQKANSKLIAAAPELLKMLQTISSILDGWDRAKYSNLTTAANNVIDKAIN
jgi:hypothetical protein